VRADVIIDKAKYTAKGITERFQQSKEMDYPEL
jgi:hypothetical protein